MRTLICLLLIVSAHSLAAQLTYETVWVDYDSAREYQSLRLIPIRSKGLAAPGDAMLSLSNAIRQGMVTVTERGTASTENVHWLRINNHSDKPVYVASGETFIGGRQDRMVTRDTILLPAGGRDQYIGVMCIEEGRWSEKEKKIVYNGYADQRLRKVLDRSRNQVLIWKEVLAQLDSAKYNSATLSYNALKQQKAFQPKELEYMHFFLDKFRDADSSIIGFIGVSGDRVMGCDIFANSQLFYDQLEPLLSGYISEAILMGSIPVLSNEKTRAYMDQILTSESMQEEYCKKNGKIFRSGDRVIHVTSY